MTEEMKENDGPLVMSIAVLGGTGHEGAGLVKRWALNGYQVIIGSRSEEKATTRAAELNEELGGDYIIGMDNAAAARAGHLVVLSVPYGAHHATLESVKAHLTGKILVDVTVPLKPPKVFAVHLPEGKSAALEAQALLGDNVKVVAAFQNVSAEKIKDPDADVNCDVLVCGDDTEAKKEVTKLVDAAGMRGVDAGPLANAVAAEALTPVLIYINKTYKAKGAGIRITNID
jgi:8-hydroxy-5-deazaflavin:NADPH oxidoreductase